MLLIFLQRIENHLASSYDVLINWFFAVAHLLQVTALEGLLGETIPLLSAIPASPRPQAWLATLEEKMRNTLVRSLGECVKRRLEKKESASTLLELLTFGENFIFILFFFRSLFKLRQEPMSRSMLLHYIPVTAFS